MAKDKGRLEAIWLKTSRNGAMDPVDEIIAVKGHGLEGNANFDRSRHITLIEKEVFDNLKNELSENVDPSMRRANFLLSGIRLKDSKNRILIVGDLRIQIQGETKPCMVMDQSFPGLKDALIPNWMGGAHGSVLNGATVRVGDYVSWEN